MRDRWYGDKRDIVKWGAVLALARKQAIPAVLQVAFYRPDRLHYRLTVDRTSEPLSVDVIRHFRDINHIQRLAANANVRIDIHKDLFQWNREFRTREDFRKVYFNKVTSKIKRYSDPVIVLLDPDTGIAPKNYDFKHVTPQEIQSILRAMKSGDVFLFYQHARQRDRGWLNSTKEEFGQAVGISVPVDTITCNEIASDVAFFVVERSKWVDSAID
ncbi:MAG: hypothetical protein JRC91_12665 [Deltaproteobacteria bacterium]|nr:hypothetical protein [Deltaproteobacteria bacterium]